MGDFAWLNREEARKVGDQGGILQIVKLKRRRTRLGELDSAIFALKRIITCDV